MPFKGRLVRPSEPILWLGSTGHRYEMAAFSDGSVVELFRQREYKKRVLVFLSRGPVVRFPTAKHRIHILPV